MDGIKSEERWERDPDGGYGGQILVGNWWRGASVWRVAGKWWASTISIRPEKRGPFATMCEAKAAARELVKR